MTPLRDRVLDVIVRHGPISARRIMSLVTAEEKPVRSSIDALRASGVAIWFDQADGGFWCSKDMHPSNEPYQRWKRPYVREDPLKAAAPADSAIKISATNSANSGLLYRDIVQKRRDLRIEGYSTLADVGMDGDWVSPYQISSKSADGPVLLAYHWLDAASIRANREVLHRLGYLPGIPFNNVLDMALKTLGMLRADLYLTQAFHLVPSGRSEAIPMAAIDLSFDAVTRHELKGRRVVSLGTAATSACQRHGIKSTAARHPSSRGATYQEKAAELAQAIASVR